MLVLWWKRGGKWTQGDLFHSGGCSFVLATCANDARRTTVARSLLTETPGVTIVG